MATEWISPTWRMPEESNQSKFENYSLDFNPVSANEDIKLGNTTYLLPGQPSSFSTSVSNPKFQELTSASRYVRLCIKGNQNGFVLRYGNGSNLQINGATTITTDVWYNIMLVYSTTGIKLYLNGSEDASASYTALSRSAFVDAAIGCYYYASSASSFWDGEINDFSLFDYALSTDQINYLYNSGTPQNPMAISGNAPVAYYPLGGGSTGDAADPATTLTIPNSSVPSATVFDFTTDYIDASSASYLNAVSNFSISTWFTTDTLASADKFLINIGSSSSELWGVQLYQGDLIVYGGSTAKYFRYNGHIAIGQWYNLVVLYNGNESASDRYKVYLNGSLLSTSSTTGTIDTVTPTFTTNLVIGKLAYSASAYWNGKISNVSVFNTTLPATGAESVESLYNYGTPPNISSYSGLKAWWKMNVDTSTWNGSDWVIGNSTTTALNFPGGTDYIDFGTGFPTTLGASATAATASGWVKINDLTQKQALFNITTAGGNYFGSFAIWHDPASNKLYAYINGNANNIYLSSGITDNNWHHLAVVYDQSAGATITDGLKLYLDGSPVTPTASAGSTPAFVDFTASLITRLGWGWNNTFTAVADMSNWAMWNSALTAGNISTLYNGGTPEATISLSPTSYYKLDNITTGIQDAGSSSNNGTITGSITEVDSFVSTLNGLSYDMTTANLVNSDLTRSIPYSSYSMDFDGTDDHIDLTEVDLGINSTVSFWINPAVTLSNEIIIGSGGASSYFLYSQATLLYYDNS
jgi:hypothetical protein